MPQYDFTTAVEARVANQEVDMMMVAGQIVWEKPSVADGPYFLNDAMSLTPNSFSDGTPNIVIGHLTMFHNDGFVTGWRWYDATSGAGNWILSLWLGDTSDGRYPDGAGTTRLSTKTVSSTGAGWRDTNLDTPVAVENDKMYVVTRYSATGYYVHTLGFGGSHGAYSDADPVYIPSAGEEVSAFVPPWNDAERSLFKVGSGDVCPTQAGINDPYYGISPIFYKSL